MTRAATPPQEVPDAADAAGGPPSPPDQAAVYRQVAALVRWLSPAARNVRIVYDLPTEDGGVTVGRLPVPISHQPDDLKGAILFVLGKMKPGEWMKGRNIAWDIDEDMDHTAGSFKRAIRELRDDGKIETHQTNGYRLAMK